MLFILTVLLFASTCLAPLPSTALQDNMRLWPTFHGFRGLDELRHGTGHPLGESSQLLFEFWGWLLKDLWVKNMLDAWGRGCLMAGHSCWWKGTSLRRISSSWETTDSTGFNDSDAENQGVPRWSLWHSYQRSWGRSYPSFLLFLGKTNLQM